MALAVLPVAHVAAQVFAHRRPDALAVEMVAGLVISFLMFDLDLLDQSGVASVAEVAQGL